MELKVLHICNRVPFPARDGGSIGILNMIKTYYASGIICDVLAMNTYKSYVAEDELKQKPECINKLWTIDIHNKINYVTLFFSLFRRTAYLIQRYSNNIFRDQLRDILLEYKYTHIIFEGIYVSSYLEICQQMSKAKFILRAHNVEYEIWDRVAHSSFFVKKHIIQFLANQLQANEKKISVAFDEVWAITTDDAQYFESIGCRHVKILPTHFEWVNHGTNKINFPPINYYHIGAMDWLPNIQAVNWFIEKVLPMVIERFSNINFHFAGLKMPTILFQRKSRNLEISGFVSNITDFIATKDALIVPLLSGSGLRLKIIEAMAAGKLVISSTIGMQGIDANPNIHYIRADTPKEWIAAIEKLNTSESDNEKMRMEAYKLVTKMYRLESFIEKRKYYFGV